MPTHSVDLQNALPAVLLAQPIGNCAAIWADDSAPRWATIAEIAATDGIRRQRQTARKPN
jgi:hypothetical protein